MQMENSAEVVLKKFWGFGSFRPLQKEVVQTVLSKKDCLALLPTGGGKSICFQVPAVCSGGTTIVISPLISLMEDQVSNLTAKGICATYISSSLAATQLFERLQNLKKGMYTLVYVAPERLQNGMFKAVLSQLNVPLIVVDEAHCIAEWGHSFRPEYAQIATFIQSFSKRPTVLALTATATPKTQQEISTSLKLKNPRVISGSFQRKNLQLTVFETKTHAVKILTLLQILFTQRDNHGIVYCATRKTTEYVCAMVLQLHPTTAIAFYHGGMTALQRSETQTAFLNNTIKIMVATNAFGMGIDKPNIRFVVHYDAPISPENYYQEIGRAGRDGITATCFTFYNSEDMQTQLDFQGENLARKQLWHVLKKARSLQSVLTSKSCKTRKLLSYFGESVQRCGTCSSCSSKTTLLRNILQTTHNQLFFQLRLQAKKQPLITNIQTQYLALTKPTSLESLGNIPGFGTGIKKERSKAILNLILKSDTMTA